MIPAEIFQKIFLFLILSLAGISAHHLVPLNSKPAKLFAGLLYMLNPYVYVRILVGHWLILFAYAILPLAIKSFINLIENRSKKNIIKVVFLTTLVGLNSHTLVMAFMAYLVIFCFKIYKIRDVGLIKSVSLTALLFLLLNTYWLFPLATAKGTLISNIGSDDLAAFAPRIESFSALFTLASMHGFWRPGYIYAKDFIPYWQVLFVFILFLAVHGFVSYYRDKKIGIYVRAFGVIGVLGLVLAAGVNSPFSEIFRWLFDHIPLMKGMRDSHKFVTLLVLVYTYLGALGVAEFENGLKSAKKNRKYISMIVVGMAILTPFIYSFTFFTGFAGQMKAGDYPQDWYEVNDFLSNDRDDFKVLFFPWHQYMDFHWVPNNDKRIATPAQHFFDKPIIQGKNIEVGGIYRQIHDPERIYMDFLLQNRGDITNFGNLIAPMNIKYILLTKEVDYEDYFFLFNQSDLELAMETENFYVFKNMHKVSKIYGVNGASYIENWDELLEKSRSEDITERVYLISNSPGRDYSKSEKRTMDYEKKSPVRYKVKDVSSMKYVVFTELYSGSWEFVGKKPIKAYGMVNAYEADGTSDIEIRYERFYQVYLPSYAISLLTFLVLISVYFGFVRLK